MDTQEIDGLVLEIKVLKKEKEPLLKELEAIDEQAKALEADRRLISSRLETVVQEIAKLTASVNLKLEE